MKNFPAVGPTSGLTFLNLFQKYITFHRNSVNVFDRREETTIQAYDNQYELVERFLILKNIVEISPTEFSITVGRSLFNYLIECREYSHNYSVRVVAACVRVLTYGAANEFIPYNPMAALKMRKTPPSKVVYLTPEELARFEDCYTYNYEMQSAKDMFLFQCYTGMDYGDMTSVNHTHIFEYKGTLYIAKDRNKTEVFAYIPYTEKVQRIFERNCFNMNLLANATLNRVIKDLARLSKIKKHLTSHIGRKTFAMNMLNDEQYSIEVVSKMLGHKSVKTTETFYANVQLERVHIEVQQKRRVLEAA